MLFTDAHSPSTVCTPTRYSVLTGRMAFRTGMRGVFTGAGGPCMIEEKRLTLGGMFQQKGYSTALFGKWHIGMTFHDKQGKPINQNGLAAVSESIIHGQFRCTGSIVDLIISLARCVVPRPIGCTPSSMVTGFPFRRRILLIAVHCPSIRIPEIIVPV